MTVKRKTFRGKAALLMGGASPEREVSLMSGAEIRKGADEFAG